MRTTIKTRSQSKRDKKTDDTTHTSIHLFPTNPVGKEGLLAELKKKFGNGRRKKILLDDFIGKLRKFRMNYEIDCHIKRLPIELHNIVDIYGFFRRKGATEVVDKIDIDVLFKMSKDMSILFGITNQNFGGNEVFEKFQAVKKVLDSFKRFRLPPEHLSKYLRHKKDNYCLKGGFPSKYIMIYPLESSSRKSRQLESMRKKREREKATMTQSNNDTVSESNECATIEKNLEDLEEHFEKTGLYPSDGEEESEDDCSSDVVISSSVSVCTSNGDMNLENDEKSAKETGKKSGVEEAGKKRKRQSRADHCLFSGPSTERLYIDQDIAGYESGSANELKKKKRKIYDIDADEIFFE